jgi:DNA-binding MarR family transcriptional regulator
MPRPRTHAPPVDELVGTAALTVRWAERLLATHDPPLTLGQYLALRSIARESLTAAELARRAGVSGPAVSQLITGLEDAGWVARSRADDDRRRQQLALSDAGVTVLESAASDLQIGLGPLLASLPPPEQDALDRAMPHVEAALGGTPPPRRPPPPPHPPHHPEGPPPRRR